MSVRPYLQIRTPFIPTTRIDDVRPVSRRSLAASAERFQTVGLADPRPWTLARAAPA